MQLDFVMTRCLNPICRARRSPSTRINSSEGGGFPFSNQECRWGPAICIDGGNTWNMYSIVLQLLFCIYSFL